MTVSVSLIIPARNEAALIGETLTAARIAVNILAADAEIIVVDNGSTDRTASIVIAYGDDPCIRLRSCERSGSAAARNVGAQEARGEVLVFVDADTLVPPDALRRI